MKIPNILQCCHFAVSSGNSAKERYVKDYEFDYYIKGNRKMYIDGVYYPIVQGSLVFRQPGQKVRSSGDYDCYMLTLDFSDRPIPEHYDRNNASAYQEEYNSYIFSHIPTVFIPKHCDDYIRILKRLSLFSYPYASGEQLAKDLVLEFLHLVVVDGIENKNRIFVSDSAATIACQYIKSNYSRNISLNELSRLVSLNTNYFVRLFKEEVGISPNHYLIQTRLQNAKNMLMETTMSVQAISYKCGYNTPSFFNYYFKKQFNITPMEYRNLYKSVGRM